MAIGIAANILNIFLNFALVYGIGYVALGYIGAPIATSIARVSLMVMAVAAIWWRSRKPATDGSENEKVSTVTMIKDTMQWSGLKEFIILAIPSILMLCFEVWGFNGNALIVARIGEKEQSAHAIVSHLIVVSFMLPLAVSVATSVRIGQRLGARDAAGAKFVCWFGIALGIGLTFINSAIMLATKGVIAKLFIEGDEDVRVLAESIVPLAALFTTSDGAQAVMSGVLRGLGRQNIGAAAGFIAYYVIGIPLSLVFGFYFDMGLWGVWLGMTLGMFVVSFVMMPYLYFAVDWNTECDKAAQRIKAQDVHQDAEETEVTDLKQQDELEMPESGAELEEI
jgi:MATE family multidrug resistance protein